VSELQLTVQVNAGVQKAESVCKPWRLSVSELHTYFVEKRYTKSVADRVVQDLSPLPCSSGRNSFARKLICLGSRSNTVLGDRKSVVSPHRSVLRRPQSVASPKVNPWKRPPEHSTRSLCLFPIVYVAVPAPEGASPKAYSPTRKARSPSDTSTSLRSETARLRPQKFLF